MLSRLMRYETARFYLWLALLGSGSAVLVTFVLVPLLSQNRVANFSGLICCSGSIFIGLILPWGIFVLRFIFLSSVRKLPERLARYGPFAEVARRIDADFHDLSEAFIDGRLPQSFLSPQPDCLILTNTWLVRLCPAGTAVVHLPDLVWLWRRDVARSAPLVMGRIDHQIGCRMANGDTWLFDTWSERRTHAILEELIERKPEVLAGYRGEWHDIAAFGPAALRAEVQSRRDQYDALPSEEQEDWLDAAIEACHRYVYRQDRQHSDGG